MTFLKSNFGNYVAKYILTERKDFKPVEKRSSTIELKDYSMNNPYVKARTIHNTPPVGAKEAGSHCPLGRGSSLL